MPIYEYRCKQCRKVSAILMRSTLKKPVCKHCGSESVDKIISSFAVVHGRNQSLDDDYDNMQRKMEGVDQDDPRSLAKLARKMQSKGGEDLGTEFNTMVERMEGGEMPAEMGGSSSEE
ncbi:MAG: hypothetical protein EXR59_01465 [Dehalococcoidia bacterium]|nr:hypothetical protein [Dehalococcoidia bacterium]